MSKVDLYEAAHAEVSNGLKEGMTEEEQQLLICKALAKQFPKWGFVGFYDKRPDDDETIYIG